jgi:predicted GIY-YIG superfamily endonuclease
MSARTWKLYTLKRIGPVKHNHPVTYTGITGRDVSVRLADHKRGTGAKTTARMRPLGVYAYVSGIRDETKALRLERAVKREKLSRKESKELSLSCSR